MTADELIDAAQRVRRDLHALNRYADEILGWSYIERRGFGHGVEAAERILLEHGHD